MNLSFLTVLSYVVAEFYETGVSQVQGGPLSDSIAQAGKYGKTYVVTTGICAFHTTRGSQP